MDEDQSSETLPVAEKRRKDDQVIMVGDSAYVYDTVFTSLHKKTVFIRSKCVNQEYLESPISSPLTSFRRFDKNENICIGDVGQLQSRFQQDSREGRFHRLRA